MTIKKLDNSQVEIKVSIPWEKWKNFLDEAVRDFSKDIKLEGFRPGKAPREIIEKKVGSEALLNSAAEKAVSKDYPKAVEKEKINAIGSPKIKVEFLKEGEDLKYTAVTAVIPEVKMQPWQKEVGKVNKDFSRKKAEVSEDEVDVELKKIATSRTKFITVNRGAGSGDSVRVDFQVSRSGVPIEGGTASDHNLILGSNTFIPGFEDKIAGMKEGEEKKFDLNFPESYHDKSLAGKKAGFKVKMKLVQKREIPEINDSFAQSLGRFKNLDDLKKSISEGIRKEKEIKIKEERRGKITEKLIEKTEVVLPEILIHEELHKMIHELESQVRAMGMELDKYLEGIKKTKDDLEKDWRPQAEKRLKAALALGEIAKDLRINVENEKVEEEMNKTLQYYKNVKDVEKNIDMKRLYDYTKAMLVNEAVFENLEKM
ncbi:MAG: trigger factor [Candidatus Moranbacteria bacterium]|nr:trigger factor [Candidatus Moranbacteria bacterium]MDD5652013.1 trigger factor [Candidatus Moranbacteria bacterium]MDX9855557.1 trigger factor [Candidatus Moranbacteria bacterium]